MHSYRRIALGIAAALALTLPRIASAQAPAMTDAEKQAEIEKLAKLSQNPVGNLISVPFQLNTNFGTLSPYDRTQNVLNIQPVIPISLGKEWNLITRTIIPVIWQPDNAATGSTSGLGNINLSLFLSPADPGKLIWGVGAALAFPTRTEPQLGLHKWTAGPSIVLLTMPGPWVVGLLANNTWSYAGDANQPEVNLFCSQIFLNYNFKKTGWYLTTAPIITADWTASSGNTWTVPLGGGGGKLVKFGRLPVNINVSAYGYAVKPTGGPSWTLRTQAAVLLPK